jgi:hypothetical protein
MDITNETQLFAAAGIAIPLALAILAYAGSKNKMLTEKYGVLLLVALGVSLFMVLLAPAFLSKTFGFSTELSAGLSGGVAGISLIVAVITRGFSDSTHRIQWIFILGIVIALVGGLLSIFSAIFACPISRLSGLSVASHCIVLICFLQIFVHVYRLRDA